MEIDELRPEEKAARANERRSESGVGTFFLEFRNGLAELPAIESRVQIPLYFGTEFCSLRLPLQPAESMETVLILRLASGKHAF
jgi:hypothetical protein